MSAAHKILSGPVLRDTARLSQRYPPIARYEVFGVSTWPIGCDTPSPFSERFPLGEHAKWRCDSPLKRGISAILARYPMKTRQMGAIPPSAILSRKGIARYGGGISHWAAKIRSDMGEHAGPQPPLAEECGTLLAGFTGLGARPKRPNIANLDGRNLAIVVAESLARVIAAIRITSVRWRSYLPQ